MPKTEWQKFIFTSGNSNKFWEVAVNESVLETRWGRVGTIGQSKSKSLDSPESAIAEMEKLIRQKTKKGYQADGNVTRDAPQATGETKDVVSAKQASKAKKKSPPKTAAPPLTTSEAMELVNDYIVEAVKNGEPSPKPMKLDAGKRILALGLSDQLVVVHACLPQYFRIIEETNFDRVETLEALLLKNALPIKSEDLDFLVEQMIDRTSVDWNFEIDLHLLAGIERHLPPEGLSETAAEKLRDFRDAHTKSWLSHDAGKTLKRINIVLGDHNKRSPLKPGETWSNEVHRHLQSLDPRTAMRWIKILNHCLEISGSKPKSVWNKKAATLLNGVEANEFDLRMNQWLPLIKQTYPDVDRQDYTEKLNETNVVVLKGLAWFCALRPSASLAKTLATTANYAYKKIPGVGPKSGSLGNACFYALAQMPEHGGLLELSVLKTKVKQIPAKKQIQKYLIQAADELGITADAIEELSVPEFGLTGPGILEEQLGDFTCRLVVTKPSRIEWQNENGKIQKTVPAAIKDDEDDAARLKEIKQLKKEIDKLLPAQKQRIENLYLQQKSWEFDFWRKHYLDHPLTSVLARRLIWNAETKDGSFDIFCPEGQLLDVNGNEIDHENVKSMRMWHPCEKQLSEIAQWRDAIERHQIQQPFKQAHREIYLLTPAEESSNTYSNRFAAHIVRQTSFRALAQARGWIVPLLGAWDGGDAGSARKDLPHHMLKAEFWFNSAELAGYNDHSGGWHLLSTDQVRFSDLDDDPIPLADVPVLLLSEILRDVDLFVSVSSVGNDADWMDRGERPAGRDYDGYWSSFAFGDLNETAKTRRAVLDKLIPRLAISEVCSLDKKFLIVKGKFNTYKIHLGSGNILMDPGDEYLCIVAKPGQQKLYLPFEGDRTLAVILSKALMLAADDKIEDSTIIAQIKRG